MMLTNVDELACYLPGLIRRRLQNIGADGRLEPAQETFPAAILFADLSGFTALTEHFSQTHPDGTEELTHILDLYFSHLVRIITTHGGDVVKFAGDGLIALWYGEEPLARLTQRAVQCGLAIQMMMAPDVWSTVVIDETARKMRARVGIGAGDVTIMHLGGIFDRWELLVTGEAVHATGAAEAAAPPGEVALTTAAWEQIKEWYEVTPLADGHWRLTAMLDEIPLQSLPLPAIDPDQLEALRSYVPKAILARIDAGQTAWLTEQRHVTVVFVHLANLNASTPLQTAQAALRAIQTCLYRYEGSINRLGTDNKGPTLLAAFGLPPFAHEDDALRGVLAAHDIVNTLTNLGVNCAIGITSGQALCSSVGGQERREYTMMGSVVNRAARLMQAARQRGIPILCDSETTAACRDRIAFQALPPIAVRGIVGPITVFQPQLLDRDRPAMMGNEIRLQSSPLIGRDVELAILRNRVEHLRAGKGGGVLVTGEAGIGKSHLAQTFAAEIARQGMIVIAGAARGIDRSPYQALRAALASAIANAKLSTTIVDLMRDVVQELWPPNLVAQTKTPELTQQAQGERIRDLLLGFFSKLTQHAPVVLVIENSQWLDHQTWPLLASLLDQELPLLLVLTGRPLLSLTDEQRRVIYHPAMEQITLRGLSPHSIHDLLARVFDVEQVDEAIWRLIAEQTQGHPFYSIELAKALRDAGLVMRQRHHCRFVPGAAATALQLARLPTTVQGLITSRFDQLPLSHQLTLKVASVIGSEFDLETLAAIHPASLNEQQLTGQLVALQQAGFIVLERFEPHLRYAFRPAAVAEAVYNLMSFGQRRQLHARLAAYLEQMSGRDPAQAAIIAHHWQTAGEPQRARPHLDQAGELAFHIGDYAGAIQLLSEARQIESPEERLRAGRRERLLAEAYYCQGRLAESYQHLQHAFAQLGLPLPTARRYALWPLLIECARQVLARLGVRLRYPFPAIDSSELTRATSLLTQLDYYQSDPLTLLFDLFRSLNLAEAAGLPLARARAYATMELALGRFPLVAAFYRWQSRRLVRRLNDPATAIWIAQAQGLALLGRGKWQQAAAILEPIMEQARQRGELRRWVECRALLCMAQARMGDTSAALAGTAEVIAYGERARDYQVQVWGRLSAAEIYLATGQIAEAVAQWQAASNLFADNSRMTRADLFWHTVLAARIALLRGETRQAQELAIQALDLIDGKPPIAIYLLRSYEALTRMPLPRRQRWMARLIRWQVGLIFPAASLDILSER